MLDRLPSKNRQPSGQGVRERTAINIFKLAPDGHTMRNPTRTYTATRAQLGQKMCRSIALDCRIGGEHDLPHRAFEQDSLELFHAEFFRTDSIEWREVPEQHKVTASEAPRVLNRDDVGRHLDDAQRSRIATGCRTDRTQISIGEHPAALALTDGAHGAFQRPAKLERSGAILLEQMERHALGRLLAYAR
jgi:hypothetical protein